MRRLLESPNTGAHDLTELSGLDCLAAASMLLAAEADGGGGRARATTAASAPAPSQQQQQQPHPILAAQRLATQAFGSRATFFLVNGTSGGLHAAVAACCADGDALVAPRSCHQSAFFAAAVAGAVPHWLEPERQRVGRGGGGVPKEDTSSRRYFESIAHGVTAEQVARAIDQAQEDDGEGGPLATGTTERPTRRNVGAVLITSPTYFGAVAHVREIARECHRRGVPLIVDEAHGAHLAPLRRAVVGVEGASPLLLPRVPEPALAQGADISVQSAHKTLTALTQAALLHVGGGGGEGGATTTPTTPPLVPAWRVARCLQALQSSSPSYLLTSSLDAARALAFGGKGDEGTAAAAAGWLAALRGADAVREGLRRRVPRARLLEDLYGEGGAKNSSVAGWDPLRIVVDVSGLGAGGPLSTGGGAAAWLERERGVVAELSLGPLVVLVWGGNGGGGSELTLQQHEEDAERVIGAFEALAEGAKDEEGERRGEEDDEDDEDDETAATAAPALSPREALFGAACLPPPRRVPLDVAARENLVSAELLCPYPPGVPEVLPGERLSKAAARRLRAALRSGGTVAGASDASLGTVLVFAGG
jgi:arginine/lysine/ornithine decarboxylase